MIFLVKHGYMTNTWGYGGKSDEVDAEDENEAIEHIAQIHVHEKGLKLKQTIRMIDGKPSEPIFSNALIIEEIIQIPCQSK